MSTIDKELVRQKIKMADGYLEDMKIYLKEEKNASGMSTETRYALERVFHLAVEKMLEVNNYFIRVLNAKPVDDLQSTFISMGDLGILPQDFARKISPITGVRNILVHQYEKLDFDLFLRNLRENIGDFETYFSHVLTFIEKK